LIAGVTLLYLITGFYFSSQQSGETVFLTRMLLPFFAFPFHVCYGVGTLVGLWQSCANQRAPNRPVPRAHSNVRAAQGGNEKTF